MPTHSIDADVRTLHGRFSRDLEPVLTIDPGDTVVFRTLDAGWGRIEQDDPFVPPRRLERDRAKDPGHALCGPVAVRGAEPGRVLEVSIDEVRPGRWGWSSAGGFPSAWNERLGVAQGPEHAIRWSIDPDQGTARSATGRVVRLRPFMGMLGMPPDEPGSHSTVPPRATGGNIDCRELVSGSRLFLPIAVRGGLFSVGDGHGLQGDGEVAGPALECPMERVALTFRVHDGPLAWPRAETPAGRVTFGFHEDLNEAMALALDGMLRWMEERDGLARKEALALSSLLVDLHVTQVVNGVRGVHAILPDGVL